MELVRESEDKARSRVEYYETRNAILTAEDVSDLKESQLQEQEQIHMKALLRLSRERVERERRAEHSILKSELQTCKKKIASIAIITHASNELDSKKCIKSFKVNKNIIKIRLILIIS